MNRTVKASKRCCLTCEHLPAKSSVHSDPVVALKVTLEEQPTICDKAPNTPFGNGDATVMGSDCPFYEKSHLIDDYYSSEKKEISDADPLEKEETTKPETLRIKASMNPPEAGTIEIGKPKKEPRFPGEIVIRPHPAMTWAGLFVFLLGTLTMVVAIGGLVSTILKYTALDSSAADYEVQKAAFATDRNATIAVACAAFLLLCIGGLLVAYSGYREKHPKTKK